MKLENPIEVTDLPFFPGNIGNIGNGHLNALLSKELIDPKPFPNGSGNIGNSWEQNENRPEISMVSPIPDDAPGFPGHFRTVKVGDVTYHQTKIWTYTDASGKPAFHVARFDPKESGSQKKEFRPLTLWNDACKLVWKMKAPEGQRPIYNLAKLASRPGVDVMVCEGEKSADAAELLFPDCVAISSMGGSKAPQKTDWAPLAGRNVILWPDHDEPGDAFVASVELLAASAGATVKSMIRNDWFSQMAEEVGSPCKDLEKGFDAADALAMGFTSDNIVEIIAKETALHDKTAIFTHTPGTMAAIIADHEATDSAIAAKAADADQKRSEARELFKDSDFALIEYVRGYRNGVYFREPFDDDDSPKKPMWLCSPLVIGAETRDNDQGNWGRLLTWEDKDGHLHTWACPTELLAADTSEFRRELMRNGLLIATGAKARQKLVDYVLTHPPQSAERVRCVSKTGWYQDRYVLSNRVFGKSDGEGVIYQGATSGDYQSAGTLADWQREIAARAADNSRILFAISCAFAGPLTEMANESGGGFQFTAETSKGKTSTLMDPAASVWGSPDRFAKKWRTTTNGIEALCLSRNDSILILDDLGQSDAKECGASAYLIANGQGKARMLKEGGNRPLTTWKTLLLSSGEIDLATHMAEAGKTARGGQVARLPSIPADAGKGMFAIENLHDQPDGRHFADCMKSVTRQFYGTAGVAFMERMTEPAMLARVKDGIRGSINQFVQLMRIPDGAAGEVGRVAARFGLVAYAGELATKLGVTGWQQGAATMAAQRCFNDWLKESGGAMGADEKALFAQVSAFLQAHGVSRFPPHDISHDELRHVQNRAGFSFNDGEAISYWAESGAFKKELCKGFNPATAAKALHQAGWLEVGPDRTQQKKRIPALSAKQGIWVYVMTDKALGGES